MKREEKYVALVLVAVLLVVGFWQEYGQNGASDRNAEKSQAFAEREERSNEESTNSWTVESSKADIENETKVDLGQIVLVGDSRTQGLQLGADVTTADFLAERGFRVDQVMDEAIFTLQDGSYGTAFDVIAENSYGHVILMFGLNELGWAYGDIFIDEYRAVVKELKAIQPEIKICIHGILPVTAARAAEGDEFNNERIQTRNALLKQLAEEEECSYIAPAAVLCDETGALAAEATTDGIHLTSEYCQLWMDEIIKQMVA